VPLAGGGLVRHGGATRGRHEHRHHEDRPLHGARMLPAHPLNRSPCVDWLGRGWRRRVESSRAVSNLGIVELSVKQARVAGWSDVGGREAALVQRCAAHDDAACEELVREHQRMVVQLALNLLGGDRDEALDLSQEVFLKVFRTIHRFRGQSSLCTWIYRIAINQARNRHRFWHRRHRADQVSLDQHVAAHGEFRGAGNSTPDRMLAQKELAARLNRALDLLPFDDRTAIVLRVIDGLSYEEIAFALGVDICTVKTRLARARQTLRAELREANTL